MAGHERETEHNVGWGRSDKHTITIANADKGAGSGAVNLGRNYFYIVIRCADCSHIAASTTLVLTTAMDESEAMCSVYNFDISANTLTKFGPTLPTSGSMQFLCVPAAGAQFFHLELSQNTSGGTAVFEVYGIAESVQG